MKLAVALVVAALLIHAQEKAPPRPGEAEQGRTKSNQQQDATKGNQRPSPTPSIQDAPAAVNPNTEGANKAAANEQDTSVKIIAIPRIAVTSIRGRADWVIWGVTILLFVIGGYQIVLLRGMLNETRIAAIAARDSANAAKQSFVMSHRPKFVIRYMDTANIKTIPISGAFRLYNSGDTKATLSRLYFTVITDDLPMSGPHEDKHGQALSHVLEPGDHLSLAFPTVTAVVKEEDVFPLFARIENSLDFAAKEIPFPDELKIYVVGWIEYADETKTKRRVGFCQKFDFRTKRFKRHPDQDYEYGDLGYPEK